MGKRRHDARNRDSFSVLRFVFDLVTAAYNIVNTDILTLKLNTFQAICYIVDHVDNQNSQSFLTETA